MIPRRAENVHVDALPGSLDTLGEVDRPALTVRVYVSTHRPSLDRKLARGDSPVGRVGLALRARQLVSRRNRERVARALERLDDAQPGLLGLADRLRDPRPVYARGVAMVSRLVQDATGPAFAPVADVALGAITAATAALDGACSDELASDR